MTDLDRTSLDRILPDVAGAPDWADVLGRSRAHERRRRVITLAAAALVAVMATASAFGVRAFFLDKGFVGLPPVGASPSTPEEGELVLHWMVRSVTIGGLQSRAWVYADGRIVWSRHDGPLPEGANESTSGYLEQRLTPDGVELLRSQLVASGLFDRSRRLVVPVEHGSAWGSVEVHDGDEPVRLEWWEPGFPHRESGAAATPEQLSALLAIDPLLAIEPSVLPATAWADRSIRAYVPSHYAACLVQSSRAPTDESSLLSLLPSKAENLLRAKSRTTFLFDVGEMGLESGTRVVGRVSYCSRLTTDEARELAETLSGHLGPGLTKWGLTYRLAEPVIEALAASLSIEPYLPHGQTQDLGGG
ncbi:MAG: hypothetical protein ACRDKK_00110 [Gaiellaceae bacterium]